MKLNDPHGGLPRLDPDWIARARALTPILDAAGPRIDADKALPPEIVDALHEARMFRMLLPRSLGGAELDLPSFFQVMLALAEGDASAAWSVSQSNGCALSAAYLDPAAARDVFGDPRAVLCWGFPAGPCRLVPAEGGWRATGTWGFGSGSRHATWVGAHCQVCDANGEPLRQPNGAPVERTALVPRAAITIVDAAWDVLGLRGTGSDSYALTDHFVPAKYAVVRGAIGRDLQRAEDEILEPEPERREAGPLYRFSPTLVFQTGFSAVALGIARAMLGSFIALATTKKPVGASALLRDNAAIQERVAISRARLDAMQAWIGQTLQATWEHCAAHGHHSFEHRVAMRLASTYAIREASTVVEDVYRDAGATAIFASQPFERRLRDMHAAAQQVQGSSVHLQTVGQHLMGLKTGLRFL